MHQIKWTDSAKESLDEHLDYVSKKWNAEITQALLTRVEFCTSQIAKNPFSYPTHRKAHQVHKCVVHKYITLFYQIRNNEVILLRFWNSSKNPESLEF